MKNVLKSMGILFCLMAVCMVWRPLKAEAEGDSRVISYDRDTNDWYSSADGGQTWTRGTGAAESAMKDGDVLLINGDNVANIPRVTVQLDAKPKEIAVVGGAVASVTANGTEVAYALGAGSTLILTSDLDLLLLYPEAVVQIFGNVGEIQAEYDSEKTITVGVTGTVGKMNAYISPDNEHQKTVYQIAAGEVWVNSRNFLTTDPSHYSLTETTSGAPENTQTSITPNSADKQLDKVPKTGDRMEVSEWLFLLAGIFAAGGAVSGLYSLSLRMNKN